MKMKHALNLEDIEALRLREGIDDVELRGEVRRLVPGDCVRVTFLGATRPNETLMVRVVRVNGSDFTGKLLQNPSKDGQSGLLAGETVRFSPAHIHSVVKHANEKT